MNNITMTPSMKAGIDYQDTAENYNPYKVGSKDFNEYESRFNALLQMNEDVQWGM